MNPIWKDAPVIAQTLRIARSLKHWTGRDLWPIGAPVSNPARDQLPAPEPDSSRRKKSPSVPAGNGQSLLTSAATIQGDNTRIHPGAYPLQAPLEPSTSPAQLAERIFHAPFVLVSHGIESDPVLNYGNEAALTLWEMTWAELTHTPSRLTAEAPNREERGRLLATVTAQGFIDNYTGIRISKTGRRFRITQATVWNLLDERQHYRGQAAMFAHWEFLPTP